MICTLNHLKTFVDKQRFKNMFLYTWVVSRSWYLLIGIAFFLTLISFMKGIQILMFIPAFVLAVFLYSLYELYRIKRSIHLKFHSDKKWNYLKVFIKKWLKHNCIIWNIEESGNINFLQANKEWWYSLDSHKNYKLLLYAFGSFDIFRHIELVWEIQSWTKSDYAGYIISEKYTHWKEMHKIDNLKSSMSEIPFIKESYSTKTQLSQVDFSLVSNDAISRVSRKNLWKFHMIMILLAVIWIAIEWNNLVLNIVMWLTITAVFLLRKKQGKLTEKFKNIVLISLFVLMLVLTRLQSDMTWPGSVFLMQILTVIYLFPRDFRNSFLYIFLTLFVFVAISLFSNQIWFILLFWVYLCTSIYLLFFISGNESFDDKEYKVWNALSFRSFLSAYSSIVVSMAILFFLLPHGNASESRTFFWNSTNEWFVSGFNEEISLENIQNIKEDRRKIIVVEDITPDQVNALWLEYFRGKRYNYFDGTRWGDTFENSIYRYEPSLETDTIKLNIKYYLNGSRYLYLPASPVTISGTDLEFWNFHNDDTTLRTYLWVNEPLSLDIEFQLSPQGRVRDRVSSQLQVDRDISSDISDIFSQYISEIPMDIRSSPEALSDYVQNKSWFSYDTNDISEDISDFLYGKKTGHCEYFATTLTIVLQELWFNPTFVSGFWYGEYNSLAGSYVVRASNAHTWVELYDESEDAWMILDPTPWESFSAREFIDSSFERVIELYDFIDIKWYTYIVNYTGSEQKKLYSYIVTNIIYIIVLSCSLIVFFYIWKIFFSLKVFVSLTKKEQVLYLLTQKFKSEENINKNITEHNPELADKVQKYLYANAWDISWREIYKLLKLKSTAKKK